MVDAGSADKRVNRNDAGFALRNVDNGLANGAVFRLEYNNIVVGEGLQSYSGQIVGIERRVAVNVDTAFDGGSAGVGIAGVFVARNAGTGRVGIVGAELLIKRKNRRSNE